jgi:hypothetical protein
MTQPRDRLPKEVMAEEHGRRRLTPIRSCDAPTTEGKPTAVGNARPKRAVTLSGGRGGLSTAGRRVPTREGGLEASVVPRMGFAVNNVLRIHS